MLVGSIQTWECKVPVSGYLEGELKDWPSHIQDVIYQAVEDKAKEVELPLAVVFSICDCTYNDDGQVDGYYLHIVLSEIVARDMRFSSEEAMKKAFDDLIASGGKIH